MRDRERRDAHGGGASARAAATHPGAIPQAAVLALQATAGNRAVAAMLQRLSKATKDYEELPGEGERGMFVTQSEKLVVGDDLQLGYAIARHEHPKLAFSDDNTMAIHAAGGGLEAREFYAAQTVIDDANGALAGVGSAVRLETPSGHAIQVRGGDPLQLVEPGIDLGEDVERGIGETATFATHVCIEVAMKVMGKLTPEYEVDAVFQGPGLEEQTETMRSTAKSSTQVTKLVEHLAQSETPSQGLHEAMTAEGENEEAGRGYGKLKTKRRKSRAEEIGVNEFARPEVGEGFATYSARAPGGKGGARWGYHYAGVVAKSRDRADYVTLENYNRGGDVQRFMRELYFKLYKKNKALVEQRLRDLDARLEQLDEAESFERLDLRKLTKKDALHEFPRSLKALVTLLRQQEVDDREQARRDAERLMNTRSAERWFFHMYGSNKGQRFHEQMVKSGYFVDPITLRVRKPG